MQFLDLRAQYQTIKEQLARAALRTLSSGSYISGRKVSAFETAVANMCGTRFAIGVNSGTDALFLSLKAFNIGKGDEVITTPFTFIATAETIAACGARPVFADIDAATLTIDPDTIKKRITKKTKAIIPVHLFGLMADMTAITKIAKRYKLFVIEDAAQSFGAVWQGKKAGTIGTVGCFSFFPSKNLGAYGDGGMIVTRSKKIADALRLLKNHGSSHADKYTNLVLGYNSRLDELQAALLHVKLRYVQRWNDQRRAIAQWYSNNLTGCGDIQFQTPPSHTLHSYHQYTIRTKYRDALRVFLKERNVPTMIYYAVPLHRQPSFAYLDYAPGSFPSSERVAKEVLSLPIYPELSKKDQRRIVKAIQLFFKRHD